MLDVMENVMEPQVGLINNLGKIFPGLKLAYGLITGFPPYAYFNRMSVAKPRIVKFFTDLRANEAASLKVGTAGFCWGGKYVTLLAHDTDKAADGRSLVDAIFTAHPSLMVVPTDVDGIKLPYSVSIGDVDMAMAVDKVKEMERILKEKGDDERYQCVIIPGARHGFAVRGNPNSEEDSEKCLQAEDQAVNWFKKWMDLKE